MNIDSLLTNINLMVDSTVVDSTHEVVKVTSNPSASFGFMMFQMLLTLLIMSVVLYFALFFFRRINSKFKYKNKTVCFKLHENLYFSTKQGLSAVQFGEKLYIIGFSGNSVNLIDVIEDKELINKLAVTEATQSDFTNTIKNYFFKGQK